MERERGGKERGREGEMERWRERGVKSGQSSYQNYKGLFVANVLLGNLYM